MLRREVRRMAEVSALLSVSNSGQYYKFRVNLGLAY